MKNKPWFLGIDLGTGSCKTAVVDGEGNVVGFGASDYPAANVHQKWQEQDPDSLLSGMVQSVRTAIGSCETLPGPCGALSIGGALHNVIALDGFGKPLSGVLTWADSRAVKQGESVKRSPAARRLYEQTGCPPHGMYPLYKIMWFRDERPDLYRKAARFVSAKEYVFHQLTGAYVVDYCLAAGSGLLNTHDHTWNDQSLDLAGLRKAQLSELCAPRTVFEKIDSRLAGEMGIGAETPLVLGSADAFNSSIGAGLAYPWQATCMVGTSAALRIIARRPILDGASRSWCYAVDQERWLVGGALNNGGVVLSWLRDLWGQAFPERSEKAVPSYEDLIALAQKAGVGAGGLICLPFLAGERSPNWDLNARGLFFGLTLEHRLEHLTRAILEGVAFRLKSVYQVLSEISEEVREIRASGGFARSPFWPQIIASVLNQNLVVPSRAETSSLGAAFWAMLGAGAVKTLEDAAATVPVHYVCRPSEEDRPTYDALYQIYERLYQAVSPLFESISALQRTRKPNRAFPE